MLETLHLEMSVEVDEKLPLEDALPLKVVSETLPVLGEVLVEHWVENGFFLLHHHLLIFFF